jgi:hypothetical protein
MRAPVAFVLASLVLPAVAPAALPGLPAPTVSAQLPGVPCSVSATFHLNRAAKTMSYGGSISCKGAGEKTIDVVPQVSRVIAGRRHWFSITLAGRYQGPSPVDPLQVSDRRSYSPSHTYRLLVYGGVTTANGHSSSVTVCSGCAGSVPSLRISPSNTFHAGPATTTRVRGTSCKLTQNGLVFSLVNGSYVVDYGANTLCGHAAARRTVTACVQVVNRINGHNVWFTQLGSCLSTGPTSTDPAQIHTARTAYLGHGYRIMARTTVTQGSTTRSATVYSAAAGP